MMGMFDKILGNDGKIDAGEAFTLWDALTSRYDVLELTMIFKNYAKDKDFRKILETGISVILDKHIAVLENLMNKYKLPLPTRPPKTVHTVTNAEVLRDELMFRLIFSGIQNFMDNHIRGIKNLKSDYLRNVFVEFLSNEVQAYNNLVKYAKLKGWLEIPPQVQPTLG